MTVKNLSKLLLSLALAFIIVSCDSNKLYEENLSVDEDGWHHDDVKTFEFDISDTLSPLNLYINVRTSTDYTFSNLFLFLHSSYPDGYNDKDTLEFILAEPSGKWLGESSGTVVENKILIFKGGRFTTPGTYKFELEHAMRQKVLPEILDVGFRVELMEMEPA